MRVTTLLIAGCCTFGLAATTASAKPLDGATTIRDVKVVRPTGGSERGSLVVWVKTRHAGLAAGTTSAAGATHHGRVTVRIPGLGRRTATHELADAAGERGYTVRFRGGGAAARKVDVRVAATQALDLDGDGTPEATSNDTATQQNVTPTPVAQTIAPTGTFGLGGFPQDNGFDASGGEVEVFWVSSDVGCVNDVTPYAAIDPVTGAFSFDHKGVKGSGTFAADGRSATVDASWDGVMGAGGPKCKGALPTNSAYTYAGPID